VAPVLSMTEAPKHPHNRARGSFVEIAGVSQAAPAPRFSRTTAEVPQPPRAAGSDTVEVLRDAGYSDSTIEALRAGGVLT
jgi:alpha-methylacyl-CoA racemase